MSTTVQNTARARGGGSFSGKRRYKNAIFTCTAAHEPPPLQPPNQFVKIGLRVLSRGANILPRIEAWRHCKMAAASAWKERKSPVFSSSCHSFNFFTAELKQSAAHSLSCLGKSNPFSCKKVQTVAFA